jgi:hypothetical protein
MFGGEETYLRLGIDARGMSAGAAQGSRALDQVSASAGRASAAASQAGSAFDRMRSQFSPGELLKGAAAFGAIYGALRYAWEASDRLDSSQRALSASAKLAGQNLGFLQKISGEANREFAIGETLSNQFTVELSKLASAAGQVKDTQRGMAAALDLGAARGMSAAQTLERLKMVILGTDDGFDRLFNRNQSAIWEEYARKIGTTGSKLNDTQKMQAVFNALLEEGGKVAGTYAAYLEGPAGQQERLRVETEAAAATVGRATNSIRAAVLPALADLAKGVATFTGGIQMMGADLAVFAARTKLWAAEFAQDFGGAIDTAASKLEWFSSLAGRSKDASLVLSPLAWAVDRYRGGNALAEASGGAAESLRGLREMDPAQARAELERTIAAAAAERTRIVNAIEGSLSGLGDTDPIQKLLEDLSKKKDRSGSAFEDLSGEIDELSLKLRLGLRPTDELPEKLEEFARKAYEVRDALEQADQRVKRLAESGRAVPAGFASYVAALRTEGARLRGEIDKRVSDPKITKLSAVVVQDPTAERLSRVGVESASARLRAAVDEYAAAALRLETAVATRNQGDVDSASARLDAAREKIGALRGEVAQAMRAAGLTPRESARVWAAVAEQVGRTGLALEDLEKRTGADRLLETGSALVSVFGELASVMSGLDTGASQVLSGVGSAIDGVRALKEQRAAVARGEKADITAVLGGFGQVVGAITSVGQAIFGQSERQREIASMLRRNAEAIEQAALELRGLLTASSQAAMAQNVARFAGSEDARQALAAISLLRSNPAGNEYADQQTAALLAQYGLSMAELRRLANETGVSVFDSKGRIVYDALDDLAQMLGITVESLSRFGEGFDTLTRLANARAQLFGYANDPGRVLADQVDIFGKMAPKLAEAYGVKAGATEEELRKALQDLFTLATSPGGFSGDPGALGGFTSIDQFLSAILGLSGSLDKMKEGVDGVTGSMKSVPEIINAELFRFRASQKSVPAGAGSGLGLGGATDTGGAMLPGPSFAGLPLTAQGAIATAAPAAAAPVSFVINITGANDPAAPAEAVWSHLAPRLDRAFPGLARQNARALGDVVRGDWSGRVRTTDAAGAQLRSMLARIPT